MAIHALAEMWHKDCSTEQIIHENQSLWHNLCTIDFSKDNGSTLPVSGAMETMQKSIGTQEQLILRRLLKECREAAGLTQRQLAERLGTFHSRVHGYESGDRRMDLVQLHEYVEAIGVPLMEFMQLYVQAVEEERRANNQSAQSSHNENSHNEG